MKTILLIDDDRFLLDMYAMKFKEEGFEVITAESSQVALDKLSAAQEKKPDIIITDILMPAMSGLEFIEEVREKKLADKAKIVVLSNRGEREDIKQAKRFKIDGYIVKASAVPSEVVEKVREILKEK